MESMKYVVITPAYNEADLIEQTIQSMAAQTLPPTKWVIVSDGSTDGTDDIVRRYLSRHPWMELVRRPEHRDRQFAAKVFAFNAGYERVKTIPYDIVGNLDADITFDPGYFAYLVEKFEQIERLGVAGTPFVEDDNISYDFRFTNIEHVSGACQLFRRACFDEIGGYQPVQGGGIDWIAVTSARMKGWQTRTFTDKTCYHHRKIGTGSHSILRSFFKHGQKDYYLGGHPLWQLFRSIYQMTNRPYGFGGLLLLLGYTWAGIQRMERPVSTDLIQFHRNEQMHRLKAKIGLRTSA